MRAALRAAFAVSMMAAALAGCQSTAPSAPAQPLPAAAPAQPAPAQAPVVLGPLTPFGWFAELAGACWKGDHPGGDSSDTQCYLAQYERLIRGSIKIYRGGALAGEGDAVFAFVPARGQVVFSQWGTGGSYSTGRITIEGETLVFVNQNPDGTDQGVRSVWHRTGPDGYRVVRERKDDSGWQEFLAVEYRRVP